MPPETSLLAMVRALQAHQVDALEDAASEIMERCSGAEVGRSLEALLREASPAARAIIGVLAQVVVEDADSEIQACGGERESQQWLAEFLGHSALRDVLLHQLHDPSALVRAAALRGVGTLTRARADDGLGHLLASWVPLAAPVLQPLASDPDPRVRAEAITALAALPTLEADSLGLIADALADPSPRVRASAIDPAGRWLPERAAARLRACASDPDPEVAARALEQRVAVQDPQIAAVLLARLDDAEHRARTCNQLRSAGLRTVPPEILARYLTAEEPPPSRLAAARALVEWADPSCHPALTAALSLDDDTAYSAMLALTRFPTAAAEPMLLQILRSTHARGRLNDAAAIALGALGTPTAQAALLDTPLRKPGSRGGGISAAILCLALGLHPQPTHARRLLALSAPRDLYGCRIAAVSLGLGQSPLPEVRDRLEGWLKEPDAVLSARAALGLLLLDPDRAAPAALRVLASVPTPRVASFENEAISLACGLRALGQRALPGGHPVRAVALSWVQAHGGAIRDALDCYRDRGRVSGYATAYSLWIRDLSAEAEGLLATP